MRTDFFYSKSTGLYVSRKPLAIVARVKSAAKQTGISLDWNDEGNICNINFDDAKKLMAALGGQILTPREYWGVYKDAKNSHDSAMISELCSNRFTEWLDRVYIEGNLFIEAPAIIGPYNYTGKTETTKAPYGRPGWFNPEGNIGNTAEPIKVETVRKRLSSKWKYWSPDISVTPLRACAPIRGYVTSVGKTSYDFGIPVDSRQPKLMLRECRKIPLVPVIDQKIIEMALDPKIEIDIFLAEHGELFAESKDSFIHKLREHFFDKLGEMALTKDVSFAAEKLCLIKNKKFSFKIFSDFIKESANRLQCALRENRDIIFVMGHKNPDTDTVVSAVIEAFRNCLIDKTVAYTPVVQGEDIPQEAEFLLGELSKFILLSKDELYKTAKNSGTARWISVDQNREPEVQKYFLSIIDHHIVCESAKNRDIPKTMEMVGSTAVLIARKIIGMGLEIDPKIARILYGAVLMDTEDRVEHKISPQEVKIIDHLKKIAGIIDDSSFYRALMSHLLVSEDAESLFLRDYKEDWGFGFAVAKIKNAFLENGEPKKPELVSDLYNMAVKNNNEKNLPLTLLKITDYADDNETVNRERIYFIFNNPREEFFKAIRDALEEIIRFIFPNENLDIGKDYIDFWGGGLQLSRKQTAPVIEPICAAFNRYFYSPSIKRWVKRDFQKKTGIISGEYSTDSEGRINNITYEEALNIAKKTGFELLSLREYWLVLNDAKRMKDAQMIQSLQGSNFVEFLDTTIYGKEYISEHGRQKIKSSIPKGNPGLIHPDDIDLKTGLPAVVRAPNEYGNPELWRYWEPDNDIVIPCRSFIFLLDQPCLDGKFHPGESFQNLGIRPVLKELIDPKISIEWNDNALTVRIMEENDLREWKWPRNIWESVQ